VRRTKTKSHRNQLLAEMTADDLDLLEPSLEPIEVALRHPIEDRNKPIKHVYFMEEGIASVVAIGGDGKEIEIGLVGPEGMTGIVVVMGNHRSANRCYIQVAGRAQRITADDFRKALKASETLRLFLLKYAQAFMAQTAHTAIANGRANVEERLARWLLMAHDRVEGDEIPLTHEFLSTMLAVRRAGVTVAVNALEERALIKAGRGRVDVLDRAGLEKLAGDYYGVPEAEWRRLVMDSR
jgi:CRP-like cAMP-binding protein